ncbi:MAG: hypothetical protein E7291_07940 [Lachnospiraceae bacterium]|nr:hypothetical protein [Lachnospiraceae bacterium]
MNDHKFCFIICTNDELLLSECLHYINHLMIPDNYEIDLLTISDAASITQGYQAAMEASDAKYKIYMHQDVFLLNRHLLADLLDIFQSDSQIGLVGLVGYDTISPNGIMWHAPRCGGLYTKKDAATYPALCDYRYSVAQDGYSCVAEVDGFFMATCQDVPWNTVELDGWDFYDAFQSVEFLQQGYKIAVPLQRHPWALHDDNQILNLTHYDKYRQRFLEKYEAFLGKHYTEVLRTEAGKEN